MSTTRLKDEIRKQKQRQRTSRYRTSHVKERERQYSRIYRLCKAEEIQNFRSQLDFYKNEVTKLLEENYLIQQENYILRQRLNELAENEQQRRNTSPNDLETLSTAASGIQSQIWEFEVNRYLQSSKLTDLIRFSLTEFQELVNLVTPHMNLLTSEGRQRIYQRRDPQRISYQAHLFITLWWLKNYEPNNTLGEIFGLGWGDVCRVLSRTITALDMALKHEIQWPSDEEFDEILMNISAHFPEPFNNVGVIVDVTPLRIFRSSNNEFQKQTYNPYRHCHCFGILIACTPDGRIIFASNPTASPSDQAIWKSLKLREQFKDKEYAVMGDSGFNFNPEYATQGSDSFTINALSPYSRRYGHNLTEEEKRFNSTLSAIRAVIENVNAQVKKWRIFGSTYRHFSFYKENTIPLDTIVRVVLKLTARYISLHPIRKPDWLAQIQWEK